MSASLLKSISQLLKGHKKSRPPAKRIDGRKELIENLQKDIARQRSGQVSEIGKEYDEFTNSVSSNTPSIAFSFWDMWVDEKNHRFCGMYDLISRDEWPRLAELVVRDLIDGKSDVTDKQVLKVLFPNTNGVPPIN